MEVWKDPKTLIIWLIIILVLFVVLLIIITFLIEFTFRKNAEKKEIIFQERIKHEREMKETMVYLQDQERKTIAAEIHDQISNKLNFLILKINSIANDENVEEFNFLKQEIKNIIQKNREISHHLFPVEIENLGLIYTLQDLSIKNSQVNFTIHVHYREQIEFASKQDELQLYRVIQEFMTNTLKYAEATEIHIHFKKFAHHIGVLISDNGKGFNLDEVQKGIGLISIENRLQTINADFKFKSRPHHGTQLIIVK